MCKMKIVEFIGNNKILTSEIKKNKAKDDVLVDITSNYRHNLCLYSLSGKNHTQSTVCLTFLVGKDVPTVVGIHLSTNKPIPAVCRINLSTDKPIWQNVGISFSTDKDMPTIDFVHLSTDKEVGTIAFACFLIKKYVQLY